MGALKTCQIFHFNYGLYFNQVLSVVIAIAFIYNPWVLNFKSSVLSDIPFTLFFVSSVFFYLRKFSWDSVQMTNSVFLGFLICFLMLIKSVGVVVIMAIFLDRLVLSIKHKTFSIKPFIDPLIASFAILCTATQERLAWCAMKISTSSDISLNAFS